MFAATLVSSFSPTVSLWHGGMGTPESRESCYLASADLQVAPLGERVMVRGAGATSSPVLRWTTALQVSY
jgi:3D (Asp-Asp-Asp) domain-containing protein